MHGKRYLILMVAVVIFFTTACSQPTATTENEAEQSDLEQRLAKPKKKLVYIWTTWCGPCRKTLTEVFPDFSRVADTSQLDVIIIAASKNGSLVNELTANTGFPASSYMLNFSGPDVALFQKLAIKNFLQENFPNEELWQNAVPVFFLLDEQNKVLETRLPNVTADDLVKFLSKYDIAKEEYD